MTGRRLRWEARAAVGLPFGQQIRKWHVCLCAGVPDERENAAVGDNPGVQGPDFAEDMAAACHALTGVNCPLAISPYLNVALQPVWMSC